METVLHDGHGPVVLDLSDVRFMDVSGARLTVRLAGRAQLHGVDLSLLEAPPVERVFELTGMRRYVPRTARRYERRNSSQPWRWANRRSL